VIAVITGASAGVGRATAREFAKHGWDVALLARNAERLDRAAEELRGYGVRALPIVADVADYRAVVSAAKQIEEEFGPIDLWINNAMATVFSSVKHLTADEIRRATEVTYLGQVHGTMVALAHMHPRNRGTIINVGSALAYRAIPLQSAYCGAKFAIRGFTDSLRSELLHDHCAVDIVMVHLPAMNTPQFDWALNKTGKRAQPVPPIFQPEVAARAIFFAASHPGRREVWVGFSTIKAILANKLFPGLLDRYLATSGYRGQLTKEPLPADSPTNLDHSVDGHYGAHGRFDQRARYVSWQMFTDRHRMALSAAMFGLAALGLVHIFSRYRSSASRMR
jgi:short-subunit dehydrogenase